MDDELYFEMGLGTRMRRLIETISTGMERLYGDAGVDIRTGHFYALYAVAERGPLTINAIAEYAGFSHSAVSQTIKKLASGGIVAAHATTDGRQKMIALTPHGEHTVATLRPLWAAAEAMVKEASAETGVDMIAAITGLEAAFNHKGVYERLQAHLDTGNNTLPYTIEPYDARWKQAFYDHNMRWLREFFAVEPIDERVLSDPEDTILAKGGEIYFAVSGGVAHGTVALKMQEPGVFELTKLGVDPGVQKGGMGRALCQKVIERFLARGGTTLFLETNTLLEPAIKLYWQLGFVEKPTPFDSPYVRANYYMEWEAPNAGDR